MATRSTISVVFNTGEVRSIYCHFDGYLEHNGLLLNEHYNTQEMAEELVRMGDASDLDKSIESSTFYARDRNEELTIKSFWNLDIFMTTYSPQEYNYLFKDGKWFVARESGKNFRELSEVLGD